MREGKTKYTEVGGIRELREAIARKLSDENKIATDPSCVCVCNGGKQALQQLFMVLVEPGDEVVIPAPYWVSYPPMVELAGAKPVIAESRPENGFKLTPAELENAITERTKAVIINSPSNPTGAAYTKEELAQFGKVIERHKGIVVVSDEMYEKITYGSFVFCSFAAACPELAARTVTVNGFSKAFSMTGWRAGYLTGPKDLVSAVGKYQSQSTSNICSITQYAALAALTGPQDFIPPMVKAFERRINLAMSIIEQTPGPALVRKPEDSFIRCNQLLKSGRASFEGSRS